VRAKEQPPRWVFMAGDSYFMTRDGFDSCSHSAVRRAHTCVSAIFFHCRLHFLVTCFAFYIRLAYTCAAASACNAMWDGVRHSLYRATGQENCALRVAEISLMLRCSAVFFQ
jgi:hypothetical protein